MKILVIPDTQVREGVPLSHLTALGNYIVDKKPDVIVHLGDHFDMPSLSSYSRRKEIEGKRALADIEAGKEGMKALMTPIINEYYRCKRNKKRTYRPEMYFLLGNHEQRLERYIEDNPVVEGVINYPQLFGLGDWGWEVVPFLKPIYIGGIMFAHYFYNPLTGRPYGGQAQTKLNNIKCSFVMGHQQGLQMATSTGNDGKKYWGIVAGSFYQHEEKYIGPQGNDHWRGVVMLHDVNDGDCSPCVISINYLLEKYYE